MRQFANYVKITPSFRVSSVTGNNVVMKSGFNEDKFFTHNDVDTSSETDEKSPGILYNISVKLYIDKLTTTQKNLYSNNVPVILTLFDVDASDKIIIGNTTSPAKVIYSPGHVYDQLIVEYSSKTPVL